MLCIELTGSDTRMDSREVLDVPLNLLPGKCDSCNFPDLDYVPQPYFLIRSRTMSPNEMAPAEQGNFLVRDRIRRVLELLAPGEIDFYPTCYQNSSDPTPWQLAVPKHQVVTAKVDPSIERCRSCNEPRSAHPGTQYSEWLWDYNSDQEVLKSATWGSSELGWDRWIDRSLFMSVRLFSLLKRIKAKGLDECTCDTQTAPNPEDAAWINTQLALLAEKGIPLNAPGTLGEEDAKWYRKYLKDNATANLAAIDWKSLEKNFKFKLPKTYKDFLSKVGACSFANVDEQEGFTAHVVAPAELDIDSYRQGELTTDDEESSKIDGVMFANTDHGDCFCFDVRKDRKEFEVYVYLHEYNYFEPYAPNFAACIRRFLAREG